ncbi:heavy-metal-associated domain-containing protein [Pararhizobium mangrovi]|uniref:Heavy-metal-associated domain-containing protein n=1 Tax=Pararhizobium mangrovi TaxID=2590452 RepID=A0A506UFN9_9HYPH|nr:heavy-metal-associated domain-containing protein [Pararhizobium mangrovi]TPW31914.1 heavy-metal-associated domain-containing protein [Pararhizobium mangrovi]
MQTYRVPDMSCGHCVSAIEKAVHEVDPAAKVTADLKAGTVAVDSEADDTRLRAAMSEAGYESERLAT